MEAWRNSRLPFEGDYDHIVPLNEGGTGVLYRAYKRNLGVDVVIKKVKKEYQNSLDQRKEADILKTLKHRFLPRIYDIIAGNDGCLYTVMDFIPGCDLERYVYQHGALSQSLVLKWIKQLCEVIEYLHQQKPPIIHCDIKPQNIMITPENDICVIDFNTSLMNFGTEMKAIGVSEGYAAPEQYNIDVSIFKERLKSCPELIYTHQGKFFARMIELAGRAKPYGFISPCTDIYSIGATAYFMLTGYQPALSLDPVIPLSRYDIQLGDTLHTVLERAMEKFPEKRFPSAHAMLQALQDLKKGDREYRRYRRTYQVVVSFLVIMGLGFSACIFGGVKSIQNEKHLEYLSLVEQGQEFSDTQQYEESYDAFVEAVSQEPKRPEAYAGLAALLYRQGRFQECIDLLDGVSFPDEFDEEGAAACATVNYVLASSYFQLENYDGALTGYQNAVALSPDTSDYMRDLAICYAKLGMLEKAQKIVAELQEQYPNQPDVLMASGEISLAQGKKEEALSLLVQAAQKSQDDSFLSQCYLLIASVCDELGNEYLEKKISYLQEACEKLKSSDSFIHVQRLAESWIQLAVLEPQRFEEAYENALSCYQQLEIQGGENFVVRQNIAVIKQYLDRFQEAEQDFLNLQNDYPNDYRVPLSLALLYADYQSTLPNENRDYTDFWECYNRAQKLYDSAKNVGVSDAKMLQLTDVADQLIVAGWGQK